jgi:RNA polymerase sigma factor (sigma-70 family)
LTIEVESYYQRYGPMVLRRCRALLKHEDKARDAMHDVFVQLLLYEDQLEDRAPSSLLYRIATNVCLNKIRSEARRPATTDDDILHRIAASEDLAARTSARSVLHRLFGSDAESSSALAVMHLVDGMTLEQVAREAKMSVSGVRKRLRALRKRLRALEDV